MNDYEKGYLDGGRKIMERMMKFAEWLNSEGFAIVDQYGSHMQADDKFEYWEKNVESK